MTSRHRCERQCERAVMELKSQASSPVQGMLEADDGAFVTFALVTGRVA